MSLDENEDSDDTTMVLSLYSGYYLPNNDITVRLKMSLVTLSFHIRILLLCRNKGKMSSYEGI